MGEKYDMGAWFVWNGLHRGWKRLLLWFGLSFVLVVWELVSIFGFLSVIFTVFFSIESAFILLFILLFIFILIFSVFFLKLFPFFLSKILSFFFLPLSLLFIFFFHHLFLFVLSHFFFRFVQAVLDFKVVELISLDFEVCL